jgi:hypothetical protein
MFMGLIGSILTEGVFAVLCKSWLYPPHHYVAYFMIAPFTVFAPVIFVLIVRCMRSVRQATAY